MKILRQAGRYSINAVRFHSSLVLVACLAVAAPAAAGERRVALTQTVRERWAAADLSQPRTAKPADAWLVLPILLGPGEELEAVRAPVALHVFATATYHGYAIAHVGLPRSAAPALQAVEHLDLVTRSAAGVVARRQRAAAARDQVLRRQLEKLVANPEALGLYPLQPAMPRQVASFSPTVKPSLEGSPVEMLILTRDALQNAFQAYADTRTAAGIPTVVRTVEWVEANYPHGADLQETLRLFLRQAYVLWDLQSLLLGGDTELVPARYAYSEYVTPAAEAPTDLYYACLDGTWNDDGDVLWGEAYDAFSGTGDNADFYPELYVGRLPVRNAADVANLQAKLGRYLSPTETDYQDKQLFMAEVLWPAGYVPGNAIIKHGADNAERLIILNDLDSGNLAANICPFQIAKMYEAPAGYTNAGPLTRAAAIDSMNAGFGIVTQIGHGFRYTMSLGDASLTNLQAATLTNGDRPFFLVMLNCTASAFDFPCLAEQFLLNPQGGAVGVLGAAREAFPDGSQIYLEAFYRGLFDNAGVSVGQALQEARLELLANTVVDGAMRWTNIITAYLGDPTLAIWYCAPRQPTLVHDTSRPLGQQQLTVQVSTLQGPVAGSTVCLWKPGDFYAVGTTNFSGVATLSLRAEVAGNATLRVSGAGVITSVANVSFGAPAAASLHATGVVVVDDGGPGTVGNGNGSLEAGETVKLQVQVKNEGGASAADVSLALSESDPFLGVGEPFVSVGNIGAGATVLAPAMTLTLGATAPDLHHVELQLVLSSTGKNWNDRLDVDLLQVAPRLVGLVVVGPGGSSAPAAGVAYELQAQFKNYGFARLDGATATLTSSDPDVNILNGSASVGNVAHLAAGTASFMVRENDVSQPNTMQVVLASGVRSWPFVLETRRPSGPTGLEADASAGHDRVDLRWLPSPSTDVAGYNVYRALAAAGPWARANADLVTSATYFGNHGLQGSTEYHYAVVAVDGSGNESPLASSVAITTNPIQNAGWPRVLRQWTSCTPVVADVDGDGLPEIFVGADVVYGWHANASEVVDGDANPSTDGIFSPLGQSYTAGLAAGDLDADGRDEIVACSWDTRQVYVFDGNGSVLPGWPRALAVSTHGIWATPALADLDLDGSPEVIVLGLDGRLYAWYGNGSEVRDGDSNAATQGVFFAIPGTATWSRGAPAVANILTSDATPEIVFGTTGNSIYMLRADGSIPAGWPRTVGDEVTSSPALGDIDGDGALEIAVPSQDGFLYVLRTDGSNQAGWPRAWDSVSGSLTPSVALHDFDGDGKLELVVAGSAGGTEVGKLAVFDWQGNTLPGWPLDIHTASEASPVLGDLNGDGSVEIVFGGESGQILGFELDASVAPGFPIRLGAEMRATPSIADADNDGDTDLVLAGWDQQVYVFDFAGAYRPGLVPWGTFKNNRLRNGAYWPSTPTDVEVSRLPRRTALMPNVPNPFNPMTRLDFDLAGPARQRARLRLFDVHGRLVRTLVDADLDPGRHSRFWDGRDDTGRAMPSGVYFYRLETALQNDARKLLLVR